MGNTQAAPGEWELKVYKRLVFPAPAELECPDCGGSGVSGELYELPGDGGDEGVTLVLLVDVLCGTCHAGAHPDYDPEFDPDDDDPEWMDDDDQDRALTPCAVCGQTHDPDGNPCPSCDDRHYNLVQAWPNGDDDQDQDDNGGTLLYMVMPCGCSTPYLVTVPAPGQGA